MTFAMRCHTIRVKGEPFTIKGTRLVLDLPPKGLLGRGEPQIFAILDYPKNMSAFDTSELF